MLRILTLIVFFASSSIAFADNIGGTSYQGPQVLNCSDAYCTGECQQVAEAAGNGFLSKSCMNKCATTNHAAEGSTPGAYMTQCLREGTKDIACAEELAGLVPLGNAPGRLEVIKTYHTLFASGGACATMK